MNRLDEIEARANAATEGPWEWEGEAKAEWEIGANSLVPSRRPDDPVLYGYGYDASGIEVKTPADAEFIAHARTDVPWLLEQVDRRDKALEKVLRLHPRVVVLHADPEFGRMEDDAICGACIVNHEPADWPCPTVEAITTALEGETND